MLKKKLELSKIEKRYSYYFFMVTNLNEYFKILNTFLVATIKLITKSGMSLKIV